MHLISYDIENDRLRLRLAKLLIRAGMYRVQYSVFMGDIKDPVWKRLYADFHKIAQSPTWQITDSILILPLHQYSMDQREVIGQAIVDWDEMTGQLHTLML